MTKDKTKSVYDSAMRFGTIMGLFWIIKFIFLPLGFKFPFMHLLFMALTCYVPILGYKFARRYREEYCLGEMNFPQAYVFLIFLYLFAALLTSVGHFVYFNFIDHGFIADTYLSQLETLKDSVNGDLQVSVEQLISTFQTIADLSPIQLTLQLFFQNIFYGSLLAIPTALLVKKHKKQL